MATNSYVTVANKGSAVKAMGLFLAAVATLIMSINDRVIKPKLNILPNVLFAHHVTMWIFQILLLILTIIFNSISRD